MQIFDAPVQVHATLGPCVATIGKYDGMHLGHQRILAEARRRAAMLGLPTVVILSEPQPEEFFSPTAAPPRLTPFDDKVAFLAELGISAVLRMRFDTALSQLTAEDFVRDFLVRDLGIRVLVIGDDFRFGRQRGGDLALLQRLAPQLGFDVNSVAKCAQGSERVSSTLVRHYLQQGNCLRAAALLGRPYTMSGEVVAGRQLGRQLGVPTANIRLQMSVLPMSGVFAVRVPLDGRLLPGVANLGFKPTVSEQPLPSLEVHLLDFSGDLYGRYLQVQFLHKLRDEEKFSGIDALKRQIAQDLLQARHALQMADAGVAEVMQA
ncbi:MAG: bifunctional riboflavin kinase/FAD synthetase [Pseudohongiellaceae bacterium]